MTSPYDGSPRAGSRPSAGHRAARPAGHPARTYDDAMTSSADLAEQIADLAGSRGLTVAAAESLTGGAVSSALAAAPEASDWYRGCVVAYSPRVKFDVLGVTPGPLVTDRCADELAHGA